MSIIKNVTLILIIAYSLWMSENYGDNLGMRYAIIVISVYIIIKPILIKLGM